MMKLFFSKDDFPVLDGTFMIKKYITPNPMSRWGMK